MNREFEETKNIEDLRRGDYVLSWNEKTGRQTYSKVTDTYTKKASDIYTMTLQSGEKILPPVRLMANPSRPTFCPATKGRPARASNSEWVVKAFAKGCRNHSFRVMKSDVNSGSTRSVSLYGAFRSELERPTEENSEWKDAKSPRAKAEETKACKAIRRIEGGRRLKKGDVLFDTAKRQLRIRDVSVEKRSETVYNFTVEGEHDYYVGEDGVLVHNEGCERRQTLFAHPSLKRKSEEQAIQEKKEVKDAYDRIYKNKDGAVMPLPVGNKINTEYAALYDPWGTGELRPHYALDIDAKLGEPILAP